ncbi:AAA family ATPase [Neorhodopirellula lusitana]|uniref:AAA family ATPase n=1 Tax=Neorhodopirellula lusitana TaxID=445327 RepID=UPI00384D5FA1
MIRKITLENFMSHAKTEIELADGLTVLTGPNNCGKSALVAALQTIATNGNTTHVMRHGSKMCRITVETDDDHTVIWERKKSTVKYKIDGEDIHRIGQKVPPQLHDVLKLDRVSAEVGASKNEYDIHFGQQKTPVFLLDETGSRAAAFFASSSDASRLIEMQGNHRTRVRESKSEAKRLSGELDKTTERLLNYLSVDELAQKIEDADKRQKLISKTEQQIARSHELQKQLLATQVRATTLRQYIDILTRLSQSSVTPSTLQAASEKTGRLRDRLTSTTIAQHTRDLSQAVCGALSQLRAPVEQRPTSQLVGSISSIRQTQTRLRLSRLVQSACGTLTAPPTMMPTQTCRQAIDRLSNQRLVHQGVNRVANRLQALVRPPSQASTERLQQTVKTLNKIRPQTERLRQLYRVFSNMRPVAETADKKPIQNAIARLQPVLKGVGQAREIAERTRGEVLELEADIRGFVEQNPKCRTCGGDINAETLMSTLPDIHSHSTTESGSGDKS